MYLSVSSNCIDRPNHLICHLISCAFPHHTLYSLLITTFVNIHTKKKNDSNSSCLNHRIHNNELHSKHIAVTILNLHLTYIHPPNSLI